MRKLNKKIIDLLIEAELSSSINSPQFKDIPDQLSNDIENIDGLTKMLDMEKEMVDSEMKLAKMSMATRVTPEDKVAAQAQAKRFKSRSDSINKLSPSLLDTKKKLTDLTTNLKKNMNTSKSSELGQLSGLNALKEEAEMREGNSPVQNQAQPNRQMVERPKRTVIVKFDTKTQSPFQVEFSERGFVVEGTRFSFETIETALHKSFNIVLNSGQGMILDQIKMQKILKYKDRV